MASILTASSLFGAGPRHHLAPIDASGSVHPHHSFFLYEPRLPRCAPRFPSFLIPAFFEEIFFSFFSSVESSAESSPEISPRVIGALDGALSRGDFEPRPLPLPRARSPPLRPPRPLSPPAFLRIQASRRPASLRSLWSSPRLARRAF